MYRGAVRLDKRAREGFWKRQHGLRLERITRCCVSLDLIHN